MRRRKTAIVPSLVLSASFVAVIPAAACGGDAILGTKDAQPDTIWYGVGAVAYCCFEAGVADVGFRPEAGDATAEASDASDAGDVRDGG